jgi:hypothetical protein
VKHFPLHLAILLTLGCASTYTIDTIPTNANILIDETVQGTTPFTGRDEKVWLFTSHDIVLEKEGYETKQFTFKPTKWIGQRVVLSILFPPAIFWAQTFPENTTIQLVPLTQTIQSEDE